MAAFPGFAGQGGVDALAVLRAEGLAGVRDLQLQAVFCLPGREPDLAAAGRGDAVFDGVLQYGLDGQERDDAAFSVRIDLPGDRQGIPEALLDKVDIPVRHLQLFLQGDETAVLPPEGRVEQYGEGGDHVLDRFAALHAGFPVDGLQGVVQEMRVDPALQRLDLGVLQLDLLLVGLFDELLQADGHVGESDAENAEFVAPAHGHGDAELPGLDAPGRVREQADGPGDAAAHKEHDQQEDRDQEQVEDKDEPAEGKDLMVLLGTVEEQHQVQVIVVAGLGLDVAEEVFPREIRKAGREGGPVGIPVSVVADAQAHVGLPAGLQGDQRLQDHVPVQAEDEGARVFHAQVQDIADEAHLLPAAGEQAARVQRFRRAGHQVVVRAEEGGGIILAGGVADQEFIAVRRDEGSEGKEPVPAEFPLQVVAGEAQVLGVADGGGPPFVPGVGQLLVVDGLLAQGDDPVQVFDGHVPGIAGIADEGGFHILLDAAKQNVLGKKAQHKGRDQVAQDQDGGDLNAQAEQAAVFPGPV